MRNCWALFALVPVGLLGGVTGCGKKEPPAPPPVAVSKDKPAPPKVDPEPVKPAPNVEDDTGAVKFETALKDPRTVVLIDTSEYRLAELDKDIKLKAGVHLVEVKLGPRTLQRRQFTIAKGQRILVELHDTERRAAEWALQHGGSVELVDAKGRAERLDKGKALPETMGSLQAIRVNREGRTGLTDADLELLKDLSALTELELFHSQIGDTAIRHVQNLTALKRLALPGNSITDKALAHLADLSALEQLDLSRTRITDNGLVQVGRLTKLQSLHLYDLRSITDAGLASLKNLTALKILNLAATSVTGAGLANLHDLPIAELHLQATPLTDMNLKQLHGFKNLKYLHLGGTPITDASLEQLKGLQVETLALGDNAKLKGTGLGALKDLPRLQVLALNSTMVDDAALPHLKALTGLKSIWITGAKFSEAGVNELRQALPKCQITR